MVNNQQFFEFKLVSDGLENAKMGEMKQKSGTGVVPERVST